MAEEDNQKEVKEATQEEPMQEEVKDEAGDVSSLSSSIYSSGMCARELIGYLIELSAGGYVASCSTLFSFSMLYDCNFC